MARSLQHQIIARALEIISDEAHWTSLAVARSVDGRPCGCLDPMATRYCALGALYRAASDLVGEIDLVQKAVKHLLAANCRPNDSLPRINDHEGREAILAMLKRALDH